tara:strand:- start:317 stop:742 length:426 start_codon:yes stop_codon:yes gene_type:complete
MNPSARLYQCARCHCQVILCRHCDRGQVYCADGCADLARTVSQQRAARRYRLTRRGRFNNAQRQRRFRARQRQKVTHHGSPPPIRLALLSPMLSQLALHREHLKKHTESVLVCHVCHCECDPFLRRDFLRPPERGKPDQRW